jgi:hypothetical protein
MNKGYLLYHGPSEIDGAPIICVATGFARKSKNKKTGPVISTWILRTNDSPLNCHKKGEDYSICGNCKNRKWSSCYVNLIQSPHQIWKSFNRGIYNPVPSLRVFEDKVVRLGAYGDPSSLPIEVIQNITKYAAGFVGYSHSWKSNWVNPELKNYCMASVDCEDEANIAIAMGWKPFLVRTKQELPQGFFACPAAKESGQKSSCEKCQACSGLKSKARRNPSIIVHGVQWKLSHFTAGIQRFKNKKRYAFEPIVDHGKIVGEKSLLK